LLAKPDVKFVFVYLSISAPKGKEI